MRMKGNYLIQARQAKQRFLTYNQQMLIRKLNLSYDETYLYAQLLRQTYRLNRKDAFLERQEGERWLDANTYEEVMTLLDLVCDSREDRCLRHRWKSMESFGLMFHQNLLQESADPTANRIDSAPKAFRWACEKMGGQRLSGADIGYAIELFDGLQIGIQFWHGDEEFLPRLRYLWDENARQYIRYETMYFAIGLLKRWILEYMENAPSD